MIPFVDDSDFTLYVGDVREVLAGLPDASVNCCVTSPPYWGLRDYGSDGQIGLEDSPDAFVAVMVDVFREVRRVLADDGTLWLNLGDSYNNRNMSRSSSHHGGLGFDSPDLQKSWVELKAEGRTRMSIEDGDLKEKDLVGIPWLVTFALRADGWYLRSDIIWAKANPMPESVTDRPTKSHEYVFLLTKKPRYFYDAEAVREPFAAKTLTHRGGGRAAGKAANQDGSGKVASGNFGDWDRPRTAHPAPRPQEETLDGSEGEAERGPDGRRVTHVEARDGSLQHRNGERWPNGGRNIRTVWEIATQPYAEAHFATFPEELPRRCITAGCPEWVCATCGKPRLRETAVTYSGHRGHPQKDAGARRAAGVALVNEGVRAEKNVETTGWSDCGHNDYRPGVVLDPFMGSGTTALVARKLNRRSIGIELSPEYAALCARRLQQLSLLA